ncbi:MAG: hypothetical protein COV67_10170 [Nitrospinae bacterium CG11_big_fil_rev_8_21_14_0_20_56_8]|nr:MAG: hypothetical protein COV67_10170 [Nitrospinae bacterium CG11_big_fil_rev_8_21_14_0_20_56_8]
MNDERPFRIRAGAILDPGDPPVERATLTVEAGRLVAVEREGEGDPRLPLVDLSDHLLLPGFVNAHCHLSLSVLENRVSRQERFTGWVRDLLAENERISFAERVEAFRRGADTLTNSGVTLLGDYVSHPELFPEYSTLPFRSVLFLETLGFRGEVCREVCERVRGLLMDHGSKGDRFRLGIAPHAPYSVSPGLFRELKEMADRFNAPFSCHVAEFPEEVRFLREGGGELETFLRERGVFDPAWNPPQTTPVRYLDGLGVLKGMAAVHLNHIEGDLDVLVQQGAGAVFCPGSTRWFGRSPIIPVRALLDRGVPVALGTDSLASNESLNFLRELKLAEAMLTDVSRVEILQMATRFGAQVLGPSPDAGTLALGAPADVVGFRVESRPAYWKDVPFESGRERADFVMVGGRVAVGERPRAE